MTEKDSKNLEEIKSLLQEMNGMMGTYMQAKLMIERDFGLDKKARQEVVKKAHKDIDIARQIYYGVYERIQKEE